MSDLKKDLEQTNLVFVYGTLKAGKGNHRLLRFAEFKGEGKTCQNFYMVGSGVPYVFPGGDYPILGELYEVPDEDTLEALDWLEGHPHHYRRTIISIMVGDTVHKAWCYLMARETSYPYPYIETHPTHGQIQVF